MIRIEHDEVENKICRENKRARKWRLHRLDGRGRLCARPPQARTEVYIVATSGPNQTYS